MRVIIEPETIVDVKNAGILGRMPCKVEFSGVLNDQNIVVKLESFFGRFCVRRQDFFGIDVAVLEQPIGPFGTLPIFVGGVDTGLGVAKQITKHFTCSIVEAFVSEIHIAEFIFD